METNYIAYYRVSTVRQERKGFSLDAQMDVVEEAVERAKGKIIGHFTDTASGTSAERKAFKEAVAMASKTKATIIVANLDRIARNFKDIYLLRDNNIPYVEASNMEAGYTDTFFKQAVAVYESERMSERTKTVFNNIQKEKFDKGLPHTTRTGNVIKSWGRTEGWGNAEGRTKAGKTKIKNFVNNPENKRIYDFIKTLKKRNEKISNLAISKELEEFGFLNEKGNKIFSGRIHIYIERFESEDNK